MISWIKLSVNIFEDEKIQIIESMPEGSQMVLTWIKLLALAGRTNREGIIAITETKAYTAESLAVIFKIYENDKNIRQKVLNGDSIEEVKDIVIIDTSLDRIYEKVKQYVSKRKVEKWLKEVSEEQIEVAINYTTNYMASGNSISNVGGFPNTMVYTPNIIDKYEEKKQ